jgi:regulator of RNase E activity RraA
MPGFFVGAEPSFIHGTMVVGINIPVRIGATTIMPGDVVLGDRTGIVFIPPHLVKGVVDAAAAKPKQ